MESKGNKAVVRRYFLQSLGELDTDVVDETFAPDHVLSSPEFGTGKIAGTEIIKRAIEEFRGSGLGCTIESQVEEGDWVATSYTLSDEIEDHMGIMISRVVDGKIAESHVVARAVSGSGSSAGALGASITDVETTPEPGLKTTPGSGATSSARKAFN
jgi:hypothetical protein